MAGITSTKKIKGQPHLLAYITPNEVEKLKTLGGQETMTPEGIPAYPESEYYGVSQSDFDKGDFSKSTDPNVGKGSTFETYKGNKNIGVDNTLKQKHGTPKQKRQAKAALAKNQYYSTSPNQTNFQKFNTWNSNKQRTANKELALKRAFQKYKDLEKYVHGDFDMDYDFTQDIYGNKIPKGLEYLTSNKGTSIESRRKNLYDVNSPIPGKFSFLNAPINKFRPDTQITLENTLNKAKAYNQLSLDPNISKEKLDALKNLGRTQDQIDFINNGGGGGGQEYLPYIPLPEEDVAEEKTFDYRFGTGQNVGRDVTLGYAANGGRITRAGGGIMNAVPRQGYFLGKIVKGVGKAIGSVADAAGKVLKSDFGKAALLAGGAYYLGGGTFGGLRSSAPGFSFSNLGSGISGLGKKLLLKDPTGDWTGKNLSLMKMMGLSAALPFIPGLNKAPENEDIGMTDRGGRLLDSQGNEVLPSGIRKEINEAYESNDPERIKAIENYYAFLPPTEQYLPYPNYAVGGRVAAQEGGLMNLGGMEKDYRNEGGFVPIGKQEKADDVPARLSVNEFVFTADAVRNAGGGDIDKGAEVMENMMKNLENGGTVSEESQGNTGAQEMFSVSERIGEVI